MIVSFHEILQDAYRRHYAVGAFNMLSINHVLGTIAAAEELNSPVILQLAEVQFPVAPIELMAPVYLKAAADAKVPVCVHLDHGQSPETCALAIKLGFNSVMFDGANLPFDENVAKTSQVVAMARKAGVDIEAELGKVGDTAYGKADKDVLPDVFTDVEESARFLELTKVDALAIAIGNLHGRYIGTPKLNIDRLKEISARNGLPLVLHGGSGTSEEDFKSCVHNGICKINVATALQMAVAAKVTQYVKNTADTNFFEMKNAAIEATKESVAYHMRLFESEGKA